MVEPLEKLEDMVGLQGVKTDLLSQILFFLQPDLHEGNLDMLHTVIQGPPGVGKSELARIIGEIYCGMGILRSSRFVVARRSDLIGKYLGHTADKTQSIINKSRGGVLLIDEAYSLGNGDHDSSRDSFSKECLDTLNQNLTENKAHFMCIIAGYEKALDQCFFSTNEGLRRRFTFRYTLAKYTPEELLEIFGRMCRKAGWTIDASTATLPFFRENKDVFVNSAGDMETLLFHAKLAHAKRLIVDDGSGTSSRKVLNAADISNALIGLKASRHSNTVKSSPPFMMYL